MPEKMDKQAERKLMAAVEDVADLVAGGQSPDAAIEKVAREEDLPRGHVRLIVNAYNVGRSARQREDGFTPREKAADFELASYANVLDRLYPPAVKTAAERELESGVSAEYLAPPTWYGARKEREAASSILEKAAAVLPPAPPPFAGSPEWQLKQAFSRADHADKVVAETRLSVTRKQDALVNGLEALTGYFKSAGSLSVADVRPNVEALYGQSGAAVLDRIVLTAPSLAKAAAVPHRRTHSTFDHPTPYALVESLVKEARDLIAANATLEKTAAAAEVFKAATLRPFVSPHPGLSVLTPDGEASWADSEATGVLSKEAGTIGGIGWGALGTEALSRVGSSLTPPAYDDRASKVLSDISTPEHEQALAAIEARAQLHQLLNRTRWPSTSTGSASSPRLCPAAP